MSKKIHDANGVARTKHSMREELGCQVQFRTVGQLRADGRRVADSAGNGGNRGTTASMRNQAVKHINKRKLVQDWCRENNLPAKPYINDKVPFTEVELGDIMNCINDNVASTDLKISQHDLPWFLAYSRMLELEEHNERQL